MKRLTIIIAAIMMSVFVITVTHSMAVGLEGIWEGVGLQYNNKHTWTIKATITRNSYSIDYPSLNCGGKLRLIKASGNRMVFKEELNYGLKRCVNGGKVIITKSGNNEAKFEWYYPNGKKGAAGTLYRFRK